MALSHIKPHGALLAQLDEAITEGMADAAEKTGSPVIAFSDRAMSFVLDHLARQSRTSRLDAIWTPCQRANQTEPICI